MNNSIGGTSPAMRNTLVSKGSINTAIELTDTGNHVTGNYVGTDKLLGSCPLGNGLFGVKDGLVPPAT